MYRLTREQFVPLDLDEVFEFFADALNLEKLTPPWLRFEILGQSPGAMQAGTLIDYRLRLRVLPIRWQSEIAVWEPPHRFVDRQVKGPYRLWIHTHKFESLANGTLVSDVVDYAVPGDDIVQRFLVGPDLEKIFDYRAQQLNAWVLEKVRQDNERVPAQYSEATE